MKCDRCAYVNQERARFCSACGNELAINLVGEVLGGRYRVLSFIGSGGMGRVYRAEHMLLEKPVAIKVLAPEYARDEAMWRRFRREAFAASRVAHPHIAATLDFAYEADMLYSVMEYVDGTPLDQLIDHRPMPLVRALDIARQIALALGAAHDAGVIHRDIKPGNVIVAEMGRQDFVKVVDFGLAVLRTGLGKARTTKGGVTMGTPAYVAPELVLGDPLDARTDVYALGSVLYEMLVGEPPFGHGDPGQLSVSHAYKQPLAPSEHEHVFTLPDEVDELVLAMLAKDPAQRPEDGTAVAEALARLLSLISSPLPVVAQISCAVLAIRFGDLEAAVEQARREVSATIHALGGHVARVPGDELVTHFDDVAAAVQAAVRLHELAIQWPMAAAVHYGVIELSPGGSVFGQTVNVALRMARSAEIGEALASREVRDALAENPDSTLRDGVRVRLGDRSVEVYPVVGLAAAGELPEIPGLIRGRSAIEFTCVCGAQGVIVTGRLQEGEPIRARCRGCNRQLSVVPYADEVVGGGLWDTLPDRAPPGSFATELAANAEGAPTSVRAVLEREAEVAVEPVVEADEPSSEDELPRRDASGSASRLSDAD
ncbi:protein kinase domain-containing protein [Haliangium sp.]|uniref:serine/threonine-protein kinase n=1 Tax=Haliangium sp. TaxID=2663208 RepID=UPI003D1093A9